MQSEIKRWGNSAAVRISSKMLAQANLDISSPITIEIQAGKIVIEAITTTTRKIKLPFSEAQLLEGLGLPREDYRNMTPDRRPSTSTLSDANTENELSEEDWKAIKSALEND